MAVFDLCVITQAVASQGRGHADVARAALLGGARMIQFREKSMSTLALFETAKQIRDLTRKHGATFIVNDRVDVAMASEADGVHLGKEDLPIGIARHILGKDALIGASVNSPEEAEAAVAAGASYLGVGPVYSTSTKADAGEAVGLRPIIEIKRVVSVPVLAIGGITCDNMREPLDAGADGIAVISAVAWAEDMVKATKTLRP